MSSEVQALVNYYARSGYPRHIQTVCQEVLKKRPNEPVLLFWRAYGLILEGSYSEALRELEALQGAREVELAVPVAMIHAHKMCKIVDEDAVSALQDQVKSEERSATERTMLQAANLYLQLGGWANLDTAKDMLAKVLQVQPNYPHAQCLAAWVELALEAQDPEDAAGGTQRALATFEEVLEAAGTGPKEIEALLGKAHCLEKLGHFPQTLDTLNQVVVGYSWFLPALVEKARVLLVTSDWEQALETAQRVLAQDAQNIEAMRLTVLFLLARESRYTLAARRMADLCEYIDRHEPKNHALYFAVAQSCSRLSGRNPAVLGACTQLMDRARKLAPEVAAYVAEFGYVQLLGGDYAAALQTFHLATQLDELNTACMYGTIYCQLMEDQVDDAGRSIELLSLMSASIDKSADLHYLNALLLQKQQGERQDIVNLLDEAISVHNQTMHGVAMGMDYFVKLQPELLMDVARLYLLQCGSEPRQSTEPVSPFVTKTANVLGLVSRCVPGLLDAQLLLAKTRLLAADLEGAMRGVTQCLRLEPTFSDAHILMAQIYLHDGKHRMAGQSLEQAVSHNFAARDSPTYHVVKAKVLIATQELEEALKILESAMALPGVKSAPHSKAHKPKKGTAEVTLQERVSIYLLLAEVHNKLGHVPEATKIIQDALNAFQGTPEEVRVTIANCDLALSRGDVEGALAMCRAIPRESPHFLKAKMAAADIYLKHRHDKRAYAMQYQELVDQYPDTQTYMMLGEAYMQIQEPERAIQALEKALGRNAGDVALRNKIGKALVMTHDYQKAVDYYEKACRDDPNQVAMQQELAELYYKLKYYEHAERVLAVALERRRDPDDVNAMMLDVQALLLLAKVHKGSNNLNAATETQMHARTTQTSLLAKLRGDPELSRVQRNLAADICFTLAEEYHEQRNYERALNFYNEALKHNDAHTKSMFALAKLHLIRNETDQCQALCVSLLRTDPDNEEAAMMLAELMFRKEHYETAIYHFQQLLERKPTHYVALAQLVHLMRRAGRLDEVPRYLRMAEKSSPRAGMAAGLWFCKGLHARYGSNPHEALKNLNFARKDPEWGTQAIYSMVEIYLNPDNDTAWDDGATEGRPADNKEALQAATRLLAEVRVRPLPTKHHILEAYALMATKNKNDIETALNNLVSLASKDPDSVPVLLAMAMAFHLLKQMPKARNNLKRVAKMPFNAAEADDFEKSWLMLSDIHILGGKFDLAQEMCKKCLKYNKSCAKAWEGMGAIMEREQSYRDAADHYEMAWKYEHETSPAVGYKLGFNYLKAKRYVEAIDVCHKVLHAFPGYPKIKKDILEKARAAIRP